MENEYEMISKHCPCCNSLIEAKIIRDSNGGFLKYRDPQCSNKECGFKQER